MQQRALAMAERFAVADALAGVEPLGSGHIHDTWLARGHDAAGAPVGAVLQRINETVFRDVEALMRNLLRVTTHLRGALLRRGSADVERRCLRPLPAREGGFALRDAEERSWRAFAYVEGTRSVDVVADVAQAHEAARAFGRFAADLADLAPAELAATIPHFHDLPRRVESLEAAARADARGRAAAAQGELAAARARTAALSAALARAGHAALPRRVVHNDCKINNLLLDARSGEPLCVIDLDTVMEGTLLDDFGELVRTASCPAAEDARDLGSVRFDLERLHALAAGYLEGAGPLPAASEIAALPLAGPLLTLENAVRFLADHLEGDVYFRIHREGHNLDRARAQLCLFDRMWEQRAQAARAVADAADSRRG